MKEFALHFLSQKRDWTSSMLTGCGPRQVLSSRKCELCFLAHSVCESFMHLLCVNHFRLLWALKCILHNSHNTSVLHMSIKGNSVSNHQIYKSSNHQIIKSSNHQIIKSSNQHLLYLLANVEAREALGIAVSLCPQMNNHPSPLTHHSTTNIHHIRSSNHIIRTSFV